MTDQDKPPTAQANHESLDLSRDDALYLSWARDVGFNIDVHAPSGETEEDDFFPSVRQQIDNWFEGSYEKVFAALWTQHVPKSGPCTVLQGEMVRRID